MAFVAPLILAAALVVAAVAPAEAQGLPVLHITALGLHADRAVVAPGERFHLTIHVHVSERRASLDELILPQFGNAVDLGDLREHAAGADGGTDFYETITVAAQSPGEATFSPAYIDAVDPATGRAMRYSSRPLTVRVSALPADLVARSRRELSVAAGAGVVVIVLLVVGWLAVALRRRRRPAGSAPPPSPAASAPPPAAAVPPAADALAGAAAAFRVQRDEVSLDALRRALFARAGVGPGATLADALDALGGRDPWLGRALAVAERARFGIPAERPAAGDALVGLLDVSVATV